jgi:hypothetical protein
MAYNSFENLEVWKKARAFAAQTYEIMKDCCDYGLKDQKPNTSVFFISPKAPPPTSNSGLYCRKNQRNLKR